MIGLSFLVSFALLLVIWVVLVPSAIAGFYMLIMSKRDRLNILAALFTLKPIFVTLVIYFLLFSPNAQFLYSAFESILNFMKGISLIYLLFLILLEFIPTVIIAYFFRNSLVLSIDARTLLQWDIIRSLFIFIPPLGLGIFSIVYAIIAFRVFQRRMEQIFLNQKRQIIQNASSISDLSKK